MKQKRVLIISPHFPPVNAADMHRVRQSLPYLEQFGWEADVICVDPAYVEAYSTDDLLLKSIPGNVLVHRVRAFSAKLTRKIGLGSLSLRSFYFVRRRGNELLRKKKFDLVFFSTTAFHVMALGPYWKKKFGVPFILDMQDPWRNDFYLDKPGSERPPKFWLNYQLDKFLERKTVPHADGLLSVSRGYCHLYQERYKNLASTPFEVLPFGGSLLDFELMRNAVAGSNYTFSKDSINLLYIGRGGHDLKKACSILFKAIKEGEEEGLMNFNRLHLWFLGTSYAKQGQGHKTIEPLAKELGISNVTEITDRVPYFESLYLLKKADVLIVPGSTDINYTASKLLPYILAKKPLLALFDSHSLVHEMLKNCRTGHALAIDQGSEVEQIAACKGLLKLLVDESYKMQSPDEKGIHQYSSEAMTRRQIDFFERVIQHYELNRKNSFVFAKLPRAGLGNKMMVWARAYAFAFEHGLPLHTTSWSQVAWGPIIRNERKKRRYSGYFRETPFIQRLYIKRKLRSLRKVDEPSPDCHVEEGCVYLFEQLFRTNDFFCEFRNHRDIIRDALLDMLRQKLKRQLAGLDKPVIGVHIRRGDFLKASTITPLTFFVDGICWIREITNSACPVTIYTDAAESELTALLQLENVKFATGKADILDLIELSQSAVLLTSIGSTFSYWASFLSNGIVLTPSGEWHVPTRPEQLNNEKYEGKIDFSDEVLKTMIRQQILAIQKAAA